jgi:hypothetical protein
MLGRQTIVVLLVLLAVASGRNYPIYKQCDSRWGSERLGTSSNTICSAGCLMSSAAMALSAIGSNYNPSTLNTWLNGHGGYVSQDLFVWASINPLGVKFLGFINRAAISSNLAAGNIVILNVHNGGHWVLATSMTNGNTVAVNDPGYATTSYTLDQIVEGSIGLYKVGNSLFDIMIDQLEVALNVAGRRDRLFQGERAIIQEQ